MARYRTYKNGITGHRYQGYYIIKGEHKGTFSILREDRSLYMDHIYDYEDCEWIIDKNRATPEELELFKALYRKEIYELSALFIELMHKNEREGLDDENKKLYKIVEKIRKRKAEDRIF